MALIVQKYGGSSVADAECMKRVARRIIATRDAGNQVVVVVSAMGKTTDNLIKLANQVNDNPDNREMDMLLSTGEQISVAILALTLHGLGAPAVSLTGPQAGIRTDDAHTKARVMKISPSRVHEHLDNGKIVVVTGFQGRKGDDEIATLGRGGSDLSAVAMAGALKADRCQIFTDVEGVYTTDPRLVPNARKLDEIAYDEMLELASLGAKVLQSRSVEFAKKYNVELEVLSSFKEAPGTIVKEEVEDMEGVVIRGIAADKDQAKVTLTGVPDQPGVAASLFGRLAEANINVDMIIQNRGDHGMADISFTVSRPDLTKAKEVLDQAAGDMAIGKVNYEDDIAKVSIVGVGMRSNAGIAHRMFDALATDEINILMISTSEIKISVVIKEDLTAKAVQVLHTAFGLDD